MDGVGRQEKNSIFVGDQLEAVGKVSRRAVEFRAKLPIPFAIYPGAADPNRALVESLS